MQYCFLCTRCTHSMFILQVVFFLHILDVCIKDLIFSLFIYNATLLFRRYIAEKMDLPVLSHEFLFFLLTTINDKNLIFLMDQFKNTPYESSFRSRVAGMLEVEFPTSIESCVDLLPTIFHSPTVTKIRFDGKHSPLCQKLRCIFVDMNTGNLNELFIENISDCLKLGVVGTRLEKCVFREVEPFLEFELIAPLLTFLDIKISYSTSLPFIVPSLGHLLCLKHLHLSNVIINDTMLRSLPSLHAAVFENF